jgi:beta-glucosidase/6-phospho-beta-glucosidase/beta-galactosidase
MNEIKRNRNDSGWLIDREFDVSIRKFLDKEYGGSEPAYAAAQKELRAALGTTRKLETKVRSNKKSLDILGISYYTVKDSGQIKHRFAVCNPVTGKPKMIHIGNDNTFHKHWDTKLEQAIALREQFVQEHRER